MKKSSVKFYTALTVFSLVGQVAWVVENMYFNVFIYNMFHATTADISRMVLASAIAAAVTTILMGALSDKIGKRKLLICLGYILWGLSILTFAFLRMDVLTSFVSEYLAAASLGVGLTILMDCVMTFFGSTANDACFNAWLTDSTDSSNRGRVEGINSMMPLVAVLAVFGGFMAFDLSQPDSWSRIYIIIGAVVTVIGFLGFILIREPAITPQKEPYVRTVVHGFLPSVIKKNKTLYAILVTYSIFGISIQVFMPYLILYYTEGLHMENYVFIMAPAILLASVLTAFYGKRYDRVQFKKAVVWPLFLLTFGYLILFFFRSTVFVFLGSLLMMSGYLCGCAVFGAAIRDYTPEGEAGRFQGPRIVFQVLIPGSVGPVIGARVLQNAKKVLNSDGTESFIPNEKIFLAALIVLVFVAVALIFVFCMLNREHCRLHTIVLSASENMNQVTAPWQEYPRPQMRRESYINLNGSWEFAVSGKETEEIYPERITVPFPPESALSGIERTHRNGQYLHYKKCFPTPEKLSGKRLLLHIGAADQIARVFINGTFVTEHEGGYLPIDADITDLVKAAENILEIHVLDDYDKTYPYGKQTRKPKGMWYTGFSGLWKTVWMEVVPELYIEKLRFTNNENQFTITVDGGERQKTICFDGREETFTGRSAVFSVENPKLWSPENPYLYEITVSSGEDTVSSYFALRILTTEVVDGHSRLCLNGTPYFFHGVLDQGYWPDGIVTPPGAECFTKDIMNMKELGFNTLRKHIKVEPELFYYECDRLGMIVWQDMVNNGTYHYIRDTVLPTFGFFQKNDTKFRISAKEKEQFLNSTRQTVEHLQNHPCICEWTIFNEGWGQFDSNEVYRKFLGWDSSRFIDVASGWFRMKQNPVMSMHVYFKPVQLPVTKHPLLLTEFGGFACRCPGHIWRKTGIYGYKSCSSEEEFQKELKILYERDVIPMAAKGLCAAIYTQLSDVEGEINGLYTYDRAVCKADKEEMIIISQLLSKYAEYSLTKL